MTCWRICIPLRGASLSPWQADTVWGSLCWELRRLEGVPALEAWLQRYREATPQQPPPLLISDGFPGDWLPAPCFPPADGEPPPRLDWLTRDEFLKARAAGVVPYDLPPRASPWLVTPAWKNTVSRRTNSSLAEKDAGGLFALMERRSREGFVTLYARVAEGELQRCRSLLAGLAEGGFGKRRSVGYGALGPPEWREERELGTAPPGAAGWISLSGFIPREADPTDGAWRVRRKSPRFGDDVPGSPAKSPLLFLEAGAVFRDDPLRSVAGGIVEKVAGDHPPAGLEGAVQYAFAFPVPAVLPPEKQS